MYQKSCVENIGYFYFNGERKEYLLVIPCQPHSINKEKIKKYMLILLLHDSS